MKTLFTLVLAAAAALAQTTPAPAKPVAPTKPATVPRSYKDIKYPPLGQVKIPEPLTFTLANGMKVYLLEIRTLPLVSGTVRIRTGNLFDPKEKIGLAGITGAVMRTGGTKTMTGDQIDEALENMAASVESSIGETSGSVSFNALKENLDAVLPIFKAVITEPQFRPEKLELAKTMARAGIARRNDEAHGIAGREFASLLYGKDAPFGWQEEYETIDAITREDLVAFHRRYYFPANTTLVVSGDFDSADMRARLEKLFADWTVKQSPVPPFPELKERTLPGVYLATKNDVTQTFFAVGHYGTRLDNKDYPALEVMADILGGGFSSRLFRRVRTELGYAYNIGAYWGADYLFPRLFEVSGSTKSESTTATLAQIREQIERLRASEVTDEELTSAKAKVMNSFVFNFDHPRKTLARIVLYEYYGYPKDFLFRYQKAVQAVTKADILRVAKQYLKPDQLTYVAVGKPDAFGKPLSELGLPVKTIDLEPKKEATKSDATTLAEGKRLFAKMQQALGGADKIAAIKDLRQTAEVAVESGGTPLKVKRELKWTAGQLRQDQQLPFGKISVYYDGKGGGWLNTPQGNMPLSGPVLRQVQDEAFRSWLNLWLSDRAEGRTVNAVDAKTIEIADKSGASVRIELDDSGLPVKTKYRSASGPQGAPAETEETYSDWQETAGVKLPRKIVTRQGDKQVAMVTVQDVQVNTGITVEELSKKP